MGAARDGFSDFTHAAVRMANSIHESGGRVRMRENGKTSYWLNNVIVIALNGKLQTAAMYGKSDCFREMKQEAARSCGMKRQSAALMMSTLGQAIMAYYQAPTLKTAPRVPAFSFCVAPTLSVWGSSLERQASLLPTVCRSCWR